jgi:hypothetical protein
MIRVYWIFNFAIKLLFYQSKHYNPLSKIASSIVNDLFFSLNNNVLLLFFV